MTEELEAVASEIKRAWDSFQEADRRKEEERQKWRDAQHRYSELKFGLRAGCLVRDIRTKEVFRVASFSGSQPSQNPDYQPKPRLQVNEKKKDGKYGLREKTLYDNWEMVETAP